jgi:signal transduction histidine kinase
VRYRDYTEGKLESSLLDLHFPILETATFREMFATGQPLIIPDVANYPNWQLPVEPLWIRSYAGLPIQVDGEVIGFLNLNSTTPNFFSPDLITPLQAFSNQIATAVQNARLYEKARELAKAEERQRLAQDLHDGVNQTIFATTMIAGSLPYLWEKDPEAVKKSLNDILRLTRSSQAGMRILLFELRPETLAQTDLATLLEHLGVTLRGKLDGTVLVKIETTARLQPDLQIALYRIAQEALTNILKHSRASHVEIILKQEQDDLVLGISDNGRGFDAKLVASDRFGLKIMRERAEAVGAQLDIQSGKGQGTSLVVSVRLA